MTCFRRLATGLLLGGSVSTLGAQSGVRGAIMVRGVAALTRAEPIPFGESLTELRVVQPTVMVEGTAFGGRLRFVGSLNFESLTVPDGELTPGGWGEGYVDRRHPHTTVHELNLAAVDVLGSFDRGARLGVVVGKGFVPFGTDDPMSRPMLKYPVNHHWAQILERAVAIAQYEVGPVAIEASLFNGDEPERAGQWPLLRLADGQWRFGDSWSARVTARPVADLEVQGSYADVRSPEHRPGAGGDADKLSASVRWHDMPEWGERYGMIEWARTSELDGFFVFRSLLGEAMVRRGRWLAAYRFERTERPEEERLGDPFRSRRPHFENSILGITRWTLHTMRVGRELSDPASRLQITPFFEATVGRVAKADDGVFDIVATYGSNRAGALSVGITMGYASRRHRMGRYGVIADPHHAVTTAHVTH